MTKQELLETYTAEQLAETVIDLQNIPTAGKINCENSGNSDLIKVKCDKCGEEFLAFLDEKYILCKKTELFGTQDANKQLNKDVERLQSEAEKYRKAFEHAKKERDCQIAEYQNKIDKLKQKLEIQETATKYAEEYIDNLKKDLSHSKNTINQIDDILEKLFGVRHDTVDKPGEFEKILKQKAENYNTIADYLCDEPISVAQTLISAKRSYELSEEEKQRSGIEKGYYHIFDVSELRQIAEHLLVYCDHNGEMEE